MKVTCTLVCALILCTPCAAIAQTQGPPVTRPSVHTPTWQTQKQLIQLFQNAAGRVALARDVMNACLDPQTPLDDQQRYDGLTIAGHTLWGDGEHADAVACFDACLQLDVDELSVFDAARMKGQSLFFLGDHAGARDAYMLAYTVSKGIVASGIDHQGYHLVGLMLITSAQLSGDHALMHMIIDEMMNDPTTSADMMATALDKGGFAAYESGDHQRANAYFTTLLSAYPDYGTDGIGHRIRIRIALLDTQGHSLENLDDTAVNEASAIIRDPLYQGTPNWAWMVSSVARYLESKEHWKSANKLRLWAVERIRDKEAAHDPSDPGAVQVSDLRFDQALLLRDAANTFREHRYFGHAQTAMQRIADELPDVPYMAAEANRELERLRTDGFPPAPLDIPQSLPPTPTP